MLLSISVLASPDSEALYIVPTTPELIDHSRFKVKIIKAYSGYDSQTISYVFPEILMGEANRVMTFEKVPGTLNQWESSEAQAFCTETGDIFSCNIVLKRKVSHLFKSIFKQVFAQNLNSPMVSADMISSIHLGKSIDHLKNLNLTAKDLVAFEQVVLSFFSNEPAGILSYEFR